jgi:high-affinity iron transporter
LTSSPASWAADEAKRLVALLDYLGSDYKNAVQDGKVLSQDEYDEMQEFAKRSMELFNQLKSIDKADKALVEPELTALVRQIGNKGDPKAVSQLAMSAKDKLIAGYNITPYPRRLPSFTTGKKIYDDNCITSYGATGKATAPAVIR